MTADNGTRHMKGIWGIWTRHMKGWLLSFYACAHAVGWTRLYAKHSTSDVNIVTSKSRQRTRRSTGNKSCEQGNLHRILMLSRPRADRERAEALATKAVSKAFYTASWCYHVQEPTENAQKHRQQKLWSNYTTCGHNHHTEILLSPQPGSHHHHTRICLVITIL